MGTEDAMGAPADAHELPAMVGEEKEVPNSDLRRLLPAKHMPDLEKGIDQEGMGTPTRRVPEVAENEEQEHLILKDLRHHQVEEVGIAGKMDPAGQKKWHAYWLLVTAASTIILNNHIHSSPKDQLFPPELAMFIVFLCAICLMLRTMKQMI